MADAADGGVKDFSVELVSAEDATPNPNRLKTTVVIVTGNPFPSPVWAESALSEGIRLENREPDPKPNPVPATMSIEGGRLSASAVWPTAATNFVLNTVVIPDGITLTVVTNATVFFAPYTGIKVEQGGTLRVIGSAEGPVVFTAAAKGDYALTVLDGGTFADSYAQFDKTTYSAHPTVTIPSGCEVSERNERVQIPVSVSGSRTSAFRVKWRATDGTATFGEDYTLSEGVVEWSGTSEGTKYITIPIPNDGVEEDSETFTVELYAAQGVNLGSVTRCTVLIRDGTAALVPIAVSAESEASAVVRLENREEGTLGKAVVCGTEWKSANGETRAVAWDTTAEEDGWKDLGSAAVLVRNSPLIAIEGGRLQSNTTWTSNTTHLVRNWVVVPTNVTLTVTTNAIVKFCEATGIKVEAGGRLNLVGSLEENVVFTLANDDTVGGDTDMEENREWATSNETYEVSVVSGGTLSDMNAAFRGTTVATFGTASLNAKTVVDGSEGVIRIPVFVSGSRTTQFSVDWKTSDGHAGQLVWAKASDGTKYIELAVADCAETFTLTLVESRGINISATANQTVVTVYRSELEFGVSAVSEASEAVRLENRADGTLARALVFGTEYIAADGETRAVTWDSTQVADGWQANGLLVRNDASIAIEGGRLSSSAAWSNNVTHLLRNWVVVPTNVTLRITAGTVVKFAEQTGFKVEAGGKLIVAGTEENPVVYTAAADDTIGGDSDLREATPNDGDYAVNIVSGGTYTDSNCAVRYTTFSNLGTASTPAKAIAALTDGLVRIPVTISTDRTTKFCVDWRTGGSRCCATASGRLTWNSKNDGTKYIELPLIAGSLTNAFDTFTVELYESQGINISTTARRCDVTIYANDQFPALASASSDESTAVRLENRDFEWSYGAPLVHGTEWKSADGETRAEAWNTTDEADGWLDIGGASVLVRNDSSIAIEGGRLLSNTTWSNATTHLVRNWVVVPTNVTLTIAAGTVVKFCDETGIKVEAGGRLVSAGTAANEVVFTCVNDDTVGGDTDLIEEEPLPGDYKITVISGGRFTDSYTPMRYGTSGTFGSVSVPAKVVAKKDGGIVRIPVSINTSRTTPFAVDWVAYDNGATAGEDYLIDSGRIEWTGSSQGTKYLEIPLDRMAATSEDEGFVIELVTGLGINLNLSSSVCEIDLYDTHDAFVGTSNGYAASDWCEVRRLDSFASTTWPLFAYPEESIAYSTSWVKSDKVPAAVHISLETPEGEPETVFSESAQVEGETVWNTEGLPFGRYRMQHRVMDVDGGQLELLAHDFIVSDAVIHDGAISSNETWNASRVHVVRGDISAKNGVTLEIEAGAIVKFMPGTGIATEGTGECIANGVTFTHIADDQMGGDTLYDGGLMVPELGAFWFSGNITTDAETEIRYATAKEVSANITTDTVWDSHTVYHVTKSIQVRSPATLTIRKGAVVKFADRVALTVNSGATLNAQGTRAAPVVFTSIKDDTAGGDSNGDGKATEPSNGIWDEINNNGTLNLSYSVVRYGGYGEFSNQGDAAIRNNGGTATLNGCTVEGSDLRLLNCTGGKMEVANTILRDGRWGLVGGNVRFVNGVITDCTTGTSGGTVINTIFYICPTAASGTTLKNSIAFECDSGTSGLTVADPLFDVEKGNWRIQKGSPCVDAGDEEVAPPVDYFGQARIGLPDIGLHEVSVRPVPSDIDLTAVSVSAPSSAVIGKALEVTWTVENIGTKHIGDSWRDVIELIDENGAVVELGRLTVSDGLMAGGRLTKRALFRVPSVNPGNARIRLKVNAERDVPEGSQTGNNVIYAESTVALVLPSIADDDYSRVTLAGGGSTAVRIPAGSGVSAIRLSGGVNISAYAGAGYVPVALRYDVAAIALSDGSYLLALPKSANKNDFNLTLQNGGSASETVELATLTDAVSVLDVFPAEMSNLGLGYLTFYGIGMDRVNGVRLEGASSRTAYDVKSASPGELTATVEMTGATPGNYTLVLETEDGATVLTSVVISVYKPKVGPKLEARLEIPSTVRQGRIYTGKVIYSNIGDSEMNAPFMRVVATDADLRSMGSDDFVSTELAIMGIAPTYPAGIIFPGETCEFEFEFKSGAAPRFMLYVEKDNTEKWDDLSPRLSEAATILNQRGRTVYDFSTILDYAELCKTGTAVRAISGQVVSSVEGKPLAGATVTVKDESGISYSDETDANGFFVIDGLSNGVFTVSLARECDAENVEVAIDNTDVIGVNFFAIPSRTLSISVCGILESESDAVSIIVKDGNGTSLVSGFTEEGMLEVPVAVTASNIVVEANLGGYALAFDYPEVASDSDVIKANVDFKAETTVRGCVRDQLGSPISGANVFVSSTDGLLSFRVVTGPDGQFSIASLFADSYLVQASAAGFLQTTSQVDIEDGIALVELPMFLDSKSGHEVSGCYMDAVDGCSAILFDSAKNAVARGEIIDGVFTFVGVLMGDYSVVVIDADLNPVAFSKCFSVNDSDINIGLLTTANVKAVTGTIVLPNGAVNAECVFEDQYGYCHTGRVASNGMVTANLPDGEYVAYVRATGCEIGEVVVTVPQTEVFQIGLVIDDDEYVDGVVHSAATTNISDERMFSASVRSLSGSSNNLNIDTRNWSVRRMRNDLKFYQDELEEMIKPLPTYKCEHNAAIFDAYVIARMRLSMEISQADAYIYSIHCGNVDNGFSIAADTAHVMAQGWDDVIKAINSLIEEGFSWQDILTVYNQMMAAFSQFTIDVAAELQELSGNLKKVTEDIKLAQLARNGKELAYKSALSQRATAQMKLNLFMKNNSGYLAMPEYNKLVKELEDAKSWYETTKVDFDAATREVESLQSRKANIKADINAARQGRFAKFENKMRKTFKFGKYGKIAGRLLTALNIYTTGREISDSIIKAYDNAQALNNRREYYGSLYLPALHSAYNQFVRAYLKKYHDNCGEQPKTEKYDDDRGEMICPYVPPTRDPNEVAGPLGVGEQRYVKPGQEMEYFVYFENAEDVDGTVLDIRVTNPLSKWLDWSTFKMGELVFSNQIDHGLEGLQNGSTEVAQKGTTYFVRNSVALDDTNGVVTVELHIHDKTTKYGQPEDPYAGILPPNDETGRGEGHFSYKINVRDDVPVGIVITNSATIYFDYNDPIETDPAWWNTVGIYHTPSLDLSDGVTTNLLLIAGQPFGELPTPPERKNWKFDGWYTGPNGTGIKATPDAIVPDGDFELYQNWLADGGIAKFEECVVLADEGSNVVVRVHGGNAENASSVKVYLTWNTASAADVNLGKMKFPVALKWATGEIGEKVIEIPIKADSLVEGEEFFTLQLAAASGMELGEARVCTVRIRDAQWPEGMSESDAQERVPPGATAVKTTSVVDGVTNTVITGYFTKKDKKGNVTAKPMPGYVFVGWVYANGKTYSTKATITDKLRKSKKVTPKFAKAYYLRGLADPANGGKVTGSGKYAEGKSVTLKATPNKYWSFVAWYEISEEVIVNSEEVGGELGGSGWRLLSKKASIKVAVTNDATYYAVFKPYPKVTVAVEGATKGGTVKGAGSYLAGKTVTLKATPKKGYAFCGWGTGNGEERTVLSLASTYKYKVPADGAALTATFKKESELAKPVLTWGDYVVDSRTGSLPVQEGDENALAARSTNLTVGVSYAAKLSVKGESAVSITKVTGLPKGLAYKSGKVTGVPTTAKTYTATVTVALASNKKKTWTYKVKLGVAALPTWAVGTFKGKLYEQRVEDATPYQDVETPVAKGSVTLTVGKTGKVSGKFVDTKKKSYSFAVGSFKSYSDGVLRTKASMKYGKKTVTVEIAVSQDGETSVGFAEVGSTAAPFGGSTAVLTK